MEIPGKMYVRIFHHKGRGKWCVEWNFNGTAGIHDFYESEEEAHQAANLFLPVNNQRVRGDS